MFFSLGGKGENFFPCRLALRDNSGPELVLGIACTRLHGYAVRTSILCVCTALTDCVP